MKKLLLLIGIMLLAACSSEPILEITGGKVRGVETEIPGIYVFRGIPYAAPPVGALRWKEPQPVVPWEGVLLADAFGPAAPQTDKVSGTAGTGIDYVKEFYAEGDPLRSEDCLYLNVWTPAPGKPREKLPVALWIHGGAYMQGFGHEIEFDGMEYAKRGVILVTINYRLGLFGYLAHPLLTGESPNNSSGNYGLLDQIAALDWIIANIEQFGGDPQNITVFGQSAGAGSVQAMVTSPLSRDKMQRAIIQSGGGLSGLSTTPFLPQMELEPEIEKSVAAATGVDYIVVCIGENSYCETTGNINDLHISQNQADLVKALAATGKPVILILNEGRPRVIADLVPLAKGIVNVMLPGNFGGDALANLLAGEENFSGRLSYTYPSGPNGYTTYDYKVCEARSPIEGPYDYFANTHIQWPFGFGISYTTYAYSNLKADKTSFTAGDALTFTVDVTNTGEVAGKESVLLYSSDLYASLMPDNRRLRAFEKISLQPGETKTVTLHIPAQDLAFVGQDGKWVLEEGDFKIGVGDQSLMIRCTQTHFWEQPNRP